MLKATGIIRHIDELGRIVVPKELRNTLRIKNGTSMEIFTNDRNELILKKYSPADSIKEFADKLTDAFNKVYDVGVLVADNDSIVSGGEKYISQSTLSEDMYELIAGRRRRHLKNSCDRYLDSKREINELLVNPVIVHGDLYGAVIVTAHNDSVIDEEIIKMSEVVTNLLEQHYS